MKSKFLSVLTILLCISFETMAECGANSCSDVKIKEMHVFFDGVVWVGTTGTETNLSNCTVQSSLIKVDTSTEGGKVIYSALLSAQARDKAIKIRTIDNVNPCQAHYVVVE